MSLPWLNLSALTHNAAKWPLPGKVLLGCALACAVFAVGDLVYLSPARERLQTVETREEALQQQLAHKKTLASGLEARLHQFQSMQSAFSQLLQPLPDESEMPGLLDDIARLTLANGLLVEGVTPLDEKRGPLFTEQPVQIGVAGGYHDLAMFVSALGGLSRIATVHDLVLRPDGNLLRLEVLAKTYWRAQPGGWAGEVAEHRPSFVYDPVGLRDPFLPVALQVDHVPGRAAQPPDLTRPRAVLESVAVDQFEMVGTLSRGKQVFALLRAASTVHRVAVGDYLGLDHGRVSAIHDGYIELVEHVPDKQGAWLERRRTLMLNVNS